MWKNFYNFQDYDLNISETGCIINWFFSPLGMLKRTTNKKVKKNIKIASVCIWVYVLKWEMSGGGDVIQYNRIRQI